MCSNLTPREIEKMHSISAQEEKKTGSGEEQAVSLAQEVG